MRDVGGKAIDFLVDFAPEVRSSVWVGLHDERAEMPGDKRHVGGRDLRS